MKKKTKEIIGKIAVGLTAALAGGFLLFGKKKDKKEVETISKIDEKKSTDGDLFI